MNKIATIVVTYNRKETLINCLDAIIRQSLPPDVIYIIDNHSGDGTSNMLLENSYIDCQVDIDNAEDIIITSMKNNIMIKYLYKSQNTGGAGGFYSGMKMAYDDNYEWYWLMDDDGIPADDGLEQLYHNSMKYNIRFANAFVIDITNRRTLSFGLIRNRNNIDDYKNTDILYNHINPFNGSFINRSIPQNIGFIKKEMFIWGDETEYMLRAVKNGYEIATIIRSIHYHPQMKGNFVNVFPFIKKKWKVMIKPKAYSHIYYRNQGYINYLYNRRYFYVMLICYLLYYSLRFKIRECIYFIISYIKGSRNIF